jgi:hypothetical protein
MLRARLPPQLLLFASAPHLLQGYNEFSLLSLSCSDYLALPSVGIQIKNRLKDENVSLSLPSQVRADSLSDRHLHACGNINPDGSRLS